MNLTAAPAASGTGNCSVYNWPTARCRPSLHTPISHDHLVSCITVITAALDELKDTSPLSLQNSHLAVKGITHCIYSGVGSAGLL